MTGRKDEHAQTTVVDVSFLLNQLHHVERAYSQPTLAVWILYDGIQLSSPSSSHKTNFRGHLQHTYIVIIMTMTRKTHRFNVGGKSYVVSQSLLDQHPNTMLARLASETWNGQGKEDEEIFIERDGERFRYVLDFLRDGKVLLPLSSEPKATFVEELEYFGIAYDSDASITSIQHFTECPGLLALAVDHLNRLRDVMQKALNAAYEKSEANLAEAHSIDNEIENIQFAQNCVTQHLTKAHWYNIKSSHKKEYIQIMTIEKASTALAPFGFRCVTLSKYSDDSGFDEIEIEALVDAPSLPPVKLTDVSVNEWCVIL